MDIIKTNRLHTWHATLFHHNIHCPVKIIAPTPLTLKYWGINIQETNRLDTFHQIWVKWEKPWKCELLWNIHWDHTRGNCALINGVQALMNITWLPTTEGATKPTIRNDISLTYICVFKTSSVSANVVRNSSNVKLWLPITHFRWNLNDFTPASQRPPKFGDLDGIKSHSMLSYSLRSHCTNSTWIM